MPATATAALAALLLLAAPANAERGRVLATAQPFRSDQLVDILRQAGYVAIQVESDRQIHFQRSGQIFYLNRYEDGDLVLYFGVTGYDRLDAGDLNEWNRQKRMTRAYLDHDGDAVLESDLLFDGGLTARKIAVWINVFVGLVDGFEDFLSERNAAHPAPDGAPSDGKQASTL